MLDVVLNSLRNKRTKDKIELQKECRYEIYMTLNCYKKCKQMKTTDKRIQKELQNGCFELEGCKLVVVKAPQGDRSLFRIARLG